MEKMQELEKWNQNVGKQFHQLGISKLWITSYGNSIASGFSMVDPIIPLLFRNVSLKKTMEEHEIELRQFHFARAQNNNEEHVLHWLLDNISEIEMNQMNHVDYGNYPSSMSSTPMTQKELEQYFPLMLEEPMRLQDIVTTKQSDLANIIIYNGATGSLIDNFTRKGKHKNLSGVTRDIKGLDGILRIIQDFNRERGTNVEVYLCGIPNVMGINVSEIVNIQLKKLSREFANVVYIEPVKEQLFRFQDGIKVDVHYSTNEYQELHIKIMKRIYEQYFSCKIKIEIDRMLYQQSQKAEFGDLALFEDYLEECFRKIKNQNIDLRLFQKDLLKYVLERYPYDYFYLPKKQLVKSIDKGKKI